MPGTAGNVDGRLPQDAAETGETYDGELLRDRKTLRRPCTGNMAQRAGKERSRRFVEYASHIPAQHPFKWPQAV